MTQIGAQMFTVREHTKTPADLAKTLAKLKQIGYDAVQVSAIGPIETDELAKILKEEGIQCAATHVSLDMMKDTAKFLEYHEAIGCKYAAIGGAPGGRNEPGDSFFPEFAKQFSAVAKPLAEKGYPLGYHNHAFELQRHANGKTSLDLIIENSGPEIWFEIDTYWVTAGGGDPAAWIRKLAGRVPAIHVKDMNTTPAQEPVMCEVGSGNLNWPAIIEASKASGVEWYLVERDRGELDPFESLKISLENMKAMGLS